MNKKEYQIRKAKFEDITNVMIVINDAKKQLREANLLQWNVTDYPNEETLKNDVVENQLYVYESNDQILGCMVVKKYDDVYQRYTNWKTSNDFLSIHRFAVHSSYSKQGIASKLMEYAELLAKSINFDLRIDTHKDNFKMQGLIKKHKYHFVGVIELDSNIDKLRDAYEKKI